MPASLVLAFAVIAAVLTGVHQQIQDTTTSADTVTMATTEGLTNTSTNTSAMTCPVGDYLCWPDTCVSACMVCDGYADCENDKDEDLDFCENSWECPHGFERCTNSSQCVRNYMCCNGVNDCDLGTDEDQAFCAETYECPEGYARCYASRQCSLDYFFCDGEDDCDVGTDEDPAVCFWSKDYTLTYLPLEEQDVNITDMMSVPCWPGDFRCWPDMCISSCVACDGYSDCKDDFDESEEFCATWQCPAGFERCTNSSQCIRNYLFCDDIENCAIGSDEDATFCANRTCPMGYALCYGSRQCVLAYFFNDGENDCNVGTDEFDQYLAAEY